MISISDSPSARYRNSPAVWATPSKNDAFISRKESNTVKTSFDEVDSTLCDVDAPQASSINIEIDPSVGEQDPKAMYLDIHEPKEVLRASLVTARQQMSEAYGKEFTAVALSADCNGVDQLRHRLHSLRVR